jgi:hypothetical protein
MNHARVSDSRSSKGVSSSGGSGRKLSQSRGAIRGRIRRKLKRDRERTASGIGGGASGGIGGESEPTNGAGVHDGGIKNRTNVTGGEARIDSKSERGDAGAVTNTGSGGSAGIDGAGASGGSGGNGSERGIGSDAASPAPRKRGRHRRECTCEKCEARRAASVRVGARPVAATPVEVNTEEILHGAASPEARPKISDFRDGFAMLWSFAYQVPMIGGLGSHWPLTSSEAAALSEQTENLLRSMPARKKKNLEKFLSTVMPAATFIIVAAMITGPRITKTQELLAKRKAGENVAEPNARPGGTVPPNPPATPRIVEPAHESTDSGKPFS